MAVAPDPRKLNRLLGVLPEAEWQRWQPHLDVVDLPLGEVLYESGGRLSHMYFPMSSIVSLLYVMEDGASAEIAVVGPEGLVGARCCSEANPRLAARSCKAPARAFA